DLLGERGRVQGDVGQDRRPVEELLVRPAGGQLRALVDARGDHAVDPVPLPGVDDGAEGDLAGRRVADRQRVGLRGETLHEVVVEAVGDEVPAGGHADLALVEERTPGGQVHRLVDVGVVQHEQRGVAAELQVGALEVPARQLPDAAAGGRGA